MKPIGEIIAPIVARAVAMNGFQRMLNHTPLAADRKRLIMAARECGAVSDNDAELLLQAHMLETA
jgi:hypothetical protein